MGQDQACQRLRLDPERTRIRASSLRRSGCRHGLSLERLERSSLPRAEREVMETKESHRSIHRNDRRQAAERYVVVQSAVARAHTVFRQGSRDRGSRLGPSLRRTWVSDRGLLPTRMLATAFHDSSCANVPEKIACGARLTISFFAMA